MTKRFAMAVLVRPRAIIFKISNSRSVRSGKDRREAGGAPTTKPITRSTTTDEKAIIPTQSPTIINELETITPTYQDKSLTDNVVEDPDSGQWVLLNELSILAEGDQDIPELIKGLTEKLL